MLRSTETVAGCEEHAALGSRDAERPRIGNTSQARKCSHRARWPHPFKLFLVFAEPLVEHSEVLCADGTRAIPHRFAIARRGRSQQLTEDARGNCEVAVGVRELAAPPG